MVQYLAMSKEHSLTVSEIVIACRNVGINLDCEGCSTLFFTGHATNHDEFCALAPDFNRTEVVDAALLHAAEERFHSVKLIEALISRLGLDREAIDREPVGNEILKALDEKLGELQRIHRLYRGALEIIADFAPNLDVETTSIGE